MAEKIVTQSSVAERRERGRRARRLSPRDSHSNWQPAENRSDPVGLLKDQDATREADLIPVRHGRMMVSPFTFYRGTAKIMAEDLSATPTAGLIVQLCGDAHLSNFGAFASPERTLLFDLNDFDETLPGPFEYDVKRLAASFTVAARNNGLSSAEATTATRASVNAYHEAMAEFATMGVLDIWYARFDEADLLKLIRHDSGDGAKAHKRIHKSATRQLDKAHTRDSLQALSKLGELVHGQYRIVSQPPVVVPARELTAYGSGEQIAELVAEQLGFYRSSLNDDRAELLGRFNLVDVARKVVGVGSVGTRAFIGLLQGRDEQDPLFLQVKEANASVLEDHLPKSHYVNHGQRVVQGQLLMQAASDIFLGWTRGPKADYYWRQLRDMKGSAEIEAMTGDGLALYGRACGWTLARAHARSGDPIAISSYLGKADHFDLSIVDFAKRYADQNERDYDAFVEAIKSGALEAVEGV